MKMKTKEGVRNEEWEKVVTKVQGWLEEKGSQYRNPPPQDMNASRAQSYHGPPISIPNR